MSQLPPNLPYGTPPPQWPYQPPGAAPYFAPMPDLLSTARRAAIALFLVGCLMSVCSGLCITSLLSGVADEALQKTPQMTEMMKQGLTLNGIKAIYGGFCGGSFVFFGLAYILFAWF